MSIRTQDRPVIRKQAVIVRRELPPRGTVYSFGCDGCRFRRDWSTESGAVNGIAKHLREAHRTTLTLAKVLR